MVEKLVEQYDSKPGDLVHSLRWYHTIELPDGTLTPGEYDLRPIIDRLPFPLLEGKRCLDVGSRDGFYAFEMERRGAAEVVSLDIGDPKDIDLPGRERDEATIARELEDGHRAFSLAREALGSAVERRLESAYSLDPDVIGRFDFALIGTLLHHLRDPVGALVAVRGVLDGQLLINDAVTVGTSALRRAPLAKMMMRDGPFWWAVNPAGLRLMAEAAGFEVESVSRPYLIPYGAGAAKPSWQGLLSRPMITFSTQLARRRGAPHACLLASSVTAA